MNTQFRLPSARPHSRMSDEIDQRRSVVELGLIPVVLAVLFALSTAAQGSGEDARTAKDRQLTIRTASFGPVPSGKPGTPTTVMLPFRLPISRATAALGYRVRAVSSFVFTP